MTTIALPPTDVRQRSRLGWTVADALAITQRNLVAYVRIPQALFFSTLQPIMFVLLFRYAFGGAIPIRGTAYVNYLLPGIFAQAVMFGSVNTAIGLADDASKGLIERFRSLPMAPSAVLAGRTLADLCRNVFVVLLMTAVGYLVGFRVQTNVAGYLAGFLLVVAFAYALSWGAAFMSMGAENGETASLMLFPIIFPFTFASSAFVPTRTMPGWLQAFANNQPVTQVINAVRALMLGGPTAKPVLHAVLWIVGMLLVLAPLAVARYRGRAS
jgi:ABC-2 type transport system permease protein/oleandomycin transport system permease protein